MKLFYKYVSVALCLILAFTVFSCCPVTKVSAAAITTMYIEGSGVRVRTGPGTNYSIIESVTNRSATVLESVQGKDYLWYKVTYFNGTKYITGYVAYNKNYIRLVTYNPDADFETKLSAFPESYRDSLRVLHQEFPNWEFIPEPVSTSFTDAVYQQSINLRKLVHFSSQPVSWRSMGLGAFDWDEGVWIKTEGNWVGASREIIAFYMDPRNFLNSNHIYMFLQQGFDSKLHTEEGVRKIIKGTFLETNYSDPNDTAYGGDYAKVLMEAAKQSGVSPYILASKIRQEIGTQEGSMVSGKYPGYEGYYNFYNLGATGKTTADILKNGLSFAKASGWNTRSKAIIEGAKRYSSGYISANQDTYYYQDFNVHNPDDLWHQYAQAVHDAFNKGSSLSKIYIGEKEFPLTFKIPVFPNMPAQPSPQPASSTKCNNYYIAYLIVNGLTPTFDMYTYEYSLKVAGDTAIRIIPVKNGTITSPEKFDLVAGDNIIKLSVKSSTGYYTHYTINVNASKNCTLYVNSTGTLPEGSVPAPSTPNDTTTPTPSVMKGDTNGDNQITLRDLANVRLHLLKISTLKGNNLLGADTDGDGTVALRDLANLRLHLLGIKKIT